MEDRITAEKLEEGKEYRLLRKLEFHEILPFIFENIRQRTPAVIIFYLVNLAFLVFLVGRSLHLPLGEYYRTIQLVVMFLLAVLLYPLLLAPFHELIHGLVYRMTGAPAIRYGADLSQFIFYVTAHRYPVGKKKFYPVAISPFLIISMVLLILIFNTSAIWSWGLSVTLLVHTTMCIGDFAMISFFQRYPGRDIYTFDDTENMISYFYERAKKEGTS